MGALAVAWALGGLVTKGAIGSAYLRYEHIDRDALPVCVPAGSLRELHPHTSRRA